MTALYRLSSPGNRSFCAGFVAVGGTVTEAAPILRFLLNWPVETVYAYAQQRGLDFEPVCYGP